MCQSAVTPQDSWQKSRENGSTRTLFHSGHNGFSQEKAGPARDELIIKTHMEKFPHSWRSVLTTSSKIQWPWASDIRKSIWKTTWNKNMWNGKDREEFNPLGKNNTTKNNMEAGWRGRWMELYLFFSSLCSLSSSLPSPVLFSFSSPSFFLNLINLGEEPKILF